MVGERDKDEGPLENADEGQGVEEEDLLSVGEGAVDGLEVGDDVLDEEGADGDDSGERVELAPEEGVALAGAEGLNSAKLRGRWRCGGGHGNSLGLIWLLLLIWFQAWAEAFGFWVIRRFCDDQHILLACLVIIPLWLGQ